MTWTTARPTTAGTHSNKNGAMLRCPRQDMGHSQLGRLSHMISKPPACQGCPAYTTSQYWVPDMYVPGSKVLILQGEVSEYDVKGQQVINRIGQGRYETCAGDVQPFQGPDGYDLFRCGRPFAGLAGLEQQSCSLASTLRCITGLTGKAQQEAAAYCQHTHFHPPASIELVVALGSVAAQAMGLEGKIEQWRGHVL